MADIQAKGFWHIDIVGIITFVVLLFGIGASYQEIKTHEEMTRDALIKMEQSSSDFRSKMVEFAKRQDNRASRQDQIDRDCPRHRHGKGGQIFYCGQSEPVFSEDPLDDPPPAKGQREP